MSMVKMGALLSEDVRSEGAACPACGRTMHADHGYCKHGRFECGCPDKWYCDTCCDHYKESD